MEKLQQLRENISKIIIGKNDTIDMVIASIIAGGHVLLEDAPGTGKTMLAKTLARSIDCDFSRIQFTPDLLPADITGLSIYNQKSGEFEYVPGPILSSIVLADEINRATPRTQSALLEAMEEGQVTVDGVSRKLNNPFMVIATENPIETAGTFPLPEAQLDRFMVQLSMEYPSEEEEIRILERFGQQSPLDNIKPVCTPEDILNYREESKKIHIHPELISYIVKLVSETRKDTTAAQGVSPRGSLSLMNLSRVIALMQGRSYVIPDDIKRIAVPVLAHRVVLYSRGNTSAKEAFIKEVLSRVEVPSEQFDRR